MRIDGAVAWRNLAERQACRWSPARFENAIPLAEHIPKFSISSDDEFFCIGSCFARNIEEHLIYHGLRVLSKRLYAPRDEETEHARANSIVNKFTTHSILNEVSWLRSAPAVNESFFEEQPLGWRDLHLKPGIKPISLSRCIERRLYLRNEYFARLKQAHVIVLTLGLAETWIDLHSGLYLNAAPSYASVRRQPERFALEITSVSQNVDALERLTSDLRAMNPAVRIIVTVSPVPLGETFSGKDVLIANTASKSVLRAAAEAFCDNDKLADYFPTYDMVMLSPRSVAYLPDCLHVKDDLVGQMVSYFAKIYMGLDDVALEFSERPYLAANPDVELAIRRGELTSGYEHWMNSGRSENRSLRP